jgi:hypothetical protein
VADEHGRAAPGGAGLRRDRSSERR